MLALKMASCQPAGMNSKILGCFFAAAFCTGLNAETLVVPVAGKGWQIEFEGPRLFMEKTDPTEEGLRYKANAGRFNLSIFVEQPPDGGGDNEACRKFYWDQGQRNPMIQKPTVKLWSAPQAECVEYEMDTGPDASGAHVMMSNINCFVSYQGKWIDVHASVIAPKPGEVERLRKLARSLVCKAFPDAAQARDQQFKLPGLGAVKMKIPAGWLAGNSTQVLTEGMPDQHTIALFSPAHPNKHWKLTFFLIGKKISTLEQLKEITDRALQSNVGASVEGKADMQEIKLARGVGFRCTFTDASLVGKPVQIGNAKVISTAFIAPQQDALGSITIFADTAEDADFESANRALETIELLRLPDV
jgi:hypothetical protein